MTNNNLRQETHDNKLLTRIDVANLLKISVFTLDLWRKNKKFDVPEIKFNNKVVRFYKKDLMDFIERNVLKE